MDSTESARGNGLQTVVDVILAPVTAFERLRTAPTWGWAFAISIVVYAACSYLITPALIHSIQASWPAMVANNPRLAALTPEQQQTGLNTTLFAVHFAWIVALFTTAIAIFICALVMLLFNAAARGSATFAMLWAAAANIAVPSLALGGIVLAVITLLRGSASFDSPAAMQTALPSLAWLAPSAGVKMIAFLGSITVFQLWGAVLIYFAMRTTARVAVLPALLTAIIMPLGTALIAAAGAR